MLKKILKVEGILELSKKAQNKINGNAGYSIYYLSCMPYVNGSAYCYTKGQKFVSMDSAYDSTCFFSWEKNYSIICK